MKKRIVIIGGGISGLAAAYYLQEQDKTSGALEIQVLEAGNHWGGIIQTEKREGFTLEAGPDAFISEKPLGYELCKQLGLASEIIGTNDLNRNSFIYKNGKLNTIPRGFYLIAPTSAFSLLSFPVLSWGAKLRMACEPWIQPRREPGDESVADFVRRRFGREAFEAIGQPMIAGIYTADPEKLSVEAALPKFKEMESRYGSLTKALRAKKSETHQASGPRYSLFLSLKDGMQTLIEALLQKLDHVSLRTNAAVSRLEYGQKWKVFLRNGENFEADAVCLTTPAFTAADLLRPSFPGLAEDLENIPYESVATVNLAYRREDIRHPLNGFGFVVPHIEGKKIMACSFSSVKFPSRAPAGHVLLRAFLGGALQRDLVEKSEADLAQIAADELKEILGIKNPPLFTVAKKWQNAMPQYHLGHLDRVKSIEEKLRNQPGLYLTGNAYRGVGIPDCIFHAEQTAGEMYEFV